VTVSPSLTRTTRPSMVCAAAAKLIADAASNDPNMLGSRFRATETASDLGEHEGLHPLMPQ
jgi:hypothetical protein